MGIAPPVIAIDGPAASGKGSAAKAVAGTLGFHCLDSGSLYRAAALYSLSEGIVRASESELVAKLAGLAPADWNLLLADPALRDEQVSAQASVVSAMAGVRELLLARQRAARQLPGLVAEGRDMGSVVFKDAILKVFLTANIEVRARRRQAELGRMGKNAKIGDVLADLRKRDCRDSSRGAAPLMQAPGAKKLDNSDLGPEETATLICGWLHGLRNGSH